jgi:hypothetical protein
MTSLEWEILRGCANRLLQNGITKEIDLREKRAVKRRAAMKNILLRERRENEELKELRTYIR